jgi:hypothetical protein
VRKEWPSEVVMSRARATTVVTKKRVVRWAEICIFETGEAVEWRGGIIVRTPRCGGVEV